jgi:plasmid segregation protein ParM
MSSKENAPLIVAVDDGYAQIKQYSETPDGRIIKTRIRSSVRSGRYGIGSVSGEGMIGLYGTEVGPFTVSDEIESENTQFDGFHTSPMNRVLVNHSILSSEKGIYAGQEINLVTGLPVSDFFLPTGFKNDEKIEAKTANLMKPVDLLSGGVAPIIKSVKVGCQAVAAWFDYAFDDDLKQRQNVSGEVAIIDIGGRTTDIAVVIGGHSVDHQRSRSTNMGVLNVYNDVSKGILSHFKLTDELKIKVIDEAVRTGKITLWNETHDVSDIVDRVIAEYQDKIAREVERRINSGATMSAIVFVGGGSALFSKIATEFRNGKIIDDPEFSNARGLFKFAKLKSQAGN